MKNRKWFEVEQRGINEEEGFDGGKEGEKKCN